MFINLKKKSRAGIMLYALLMVAVFSLLLQFYLQSQLSESRIVLFNREGTEAYMMAELTLDTVRQDIQEMGKASKVQAEKEQFSQWNNMGQSSQKSRVGKKKILSTKVENKKKMEELEIEEVPQELHLQGELYFSTGRSEYRSEKDLLLVTVTTTANHDFFYSFPLPSEK